MNKEKVEYVYEEDEEEEDIPGIIIVDNKGTQYEGPFASLEEHYFYTDIPNMMDLIPSLYSKEKSKEEVGNDR